MLDWTAYQVFHQELEQTVINHKRLRKWLKKDRIGVAFIAVALLTTAFYKLNVCDVKQKGREHRICMSVCESVVSHIPCFR